MADGEEMEKLISLFEACKHDLRIFMNGVVQYIGEHPDLTHPKSDVIHSYKSRLKDNEHLREKISRKISNGRQLDENNFFSEITDLAGVRILMLFQSNFEQVNRVINRKVNDGDWVLGEKPKAYTWDPESAAYFRQFDLDVIEKSTSYTSVHYLIRPRDDSPLCCEVQVRTLFEEIWGEVDHKINYPIPTESVASREQIKVLSKIVGAGSRLLDSIQRIRESEDKRE